MTYLDTITWYGAQIDCSTCHLFDRHLYYFGSLERKTEELCYGLLAPNDTFVDVGSNIGVFTCLAAKRAQHGKVVAIEASPSTFSRLNANININHSKNVIAINRAAGYKKTRVYMDCPCELSTHSGVCRVSGEEQPDSLGAVQAAPLDEILVEAGIDDVKMIKIDVEGAEVNVVRYLP